MIHPCPRLVGRGSGMAVSCGLGCRRILDPKLLWLWCRLEAVAQIQPQASEPPYAVSVALKKKKKKKKKKKRNWNPCALLVGM